MFVNFFRIKKWVSVEKEHDPQGIGIDQAYEIAMKGKRYTIDEKTTIMQKWSAAKYFKGSEKKYTNRVDAINDFRLSIKTQLKIYKINVDEGHNWISNTSENSKKCFHNLFDCIFAVNGPMEVLDEMSSILDLSDIFIDPIAIPTQQIVEKFLQQNMNTDLVHRIRNRLKHLIQKNSRSECWCEPNIKSDFESHIKRLDSELVARLKS